MKKIAVCLFAIIIPYFLVAFIAWDVFPFADIENRGMYLLLLFLSAFIAGEYLISQ